LWQSSTEKSSARTKCAVYSRVVVYGFTVKHYQELRQTLSNALCFKKRDDGEIFLTFTMIELQKLKITVTRIWHTVVTFYSNYPLPRIEVVHLHIVTLSGDYNGQSLTTGM
jgi:hypothetical protein